jgi:hypothetical protein
MLGLVARSQLYADSLNGVPMKILDILPVKMAVSSTNRPTHKARRGSPAGRVFNSFRR